MVDGYIMGGVGSCVYRIADVSASDASVLTIPFF